LIVTASANAQIVRGAAQSEPAKFDLKMAGNDIIVVGASAGGVRALQDLAAGLPPDLRASLFVVLHVPPGTRSDLPWILGRSGPLPAVQAAEDATIEPGFIYVAPPDLHLLIDDHKVHLWRGPKENRQRPSVNALFRSAAVAHGNRVTGIVLTGALDDGTTGLWWIKRHGGVCIVQDPLEAAYPDMPRSALEHVDVDYILRVSEMGALLAGLAAGRKPKNQPSEIPDAAKDLPNGKQTEY